jgi:hypothetical protein|eukprot:CAMPEP_0174291256 /NCGR_PEP_ID=MMETSP0809-20121228/31470_1 /TAXON_ID=73025 ORGANISM="Eutreptiella gymnastica-like, Strain CCMP1594" /NCGR_SAMPLE_ID=MMETSP0809 /ASSEMBLY_ACC=CAM_ASM_000658 /LENGTH=296 /DNA_ID=CAMNT_0015390455 /DNA_START=33 /DNA_END=923 /DNA_ORIENTATION=+
MTWSDYNPSQQCSASQCLASHGTYYTIVDMNHIEPTRKTTRIFGTRLSTCLVCVMGMLGMTILCIATGHDITRYVTNLRWTTFDVEASQGSNVANVGVDVGAYSRRWHGQLTGKLVPGVWKIGLSKETGQPFTESAEVSIREGMAAIRLGVTKTAGSLVNMIWKSSVETSNEYTYGGALGARFQPVIVAGTIGTREGDTTLNAGFVTDGRQYKLRAGAEGKKGDHKWKLEAQSGTKSRPIIWKANVNTEQSFDLQKHTNPEYGVTRGPARVPTTRTGKPYNTYTYTGEEESFPPEY